MANVTLKAAKIVEAAMLLLQREIVLPRTVFMLRQQDFVGALNDTVTLRVPAVVEARTRTVRATTALDADEYTEIPVPVTLATHIYTLLNLTDADLTLDIFDFTSQVLQPQIRAVAEGAENVIAAALAAAPVAAAHDIDWTYTDDPKTMLNAANKVLNIQNVPRAGRVLVVGANVEEALLNDDTFRKANSSGSTTALEEAQIGRASGFTILGSNAIGADAGYAYHPTAIAAAFMAPANPEGAAMSQSIQDRGMAMRFLKDYNPLTVSDRSLVDMFAGASPVVEGGVNKRLAVITGSAV